MVAAMASRVFLVVCICVGQAVLATAAHAQADAAEVEALIAKGNELRRAGTPGPALPYFQKAYDLARTPRTTGQLGLAELAAGYPVEAEAHLATALESPNDAGIVKYRQMLKDALTMARGQIGELSVQGVPVGAEWGPFIPVKTSNGVTIDFVDGENDVRMQHYAFLVDDAEFDAAFARIKKAGLTYWADPHKGQPGAINHHWGGRGVYFEDPNGHLLELITKPYGDLADL